MILAKALVERLLHQFVLAGVMVIIVCTKPVFAGIDSLQLAQKLVQAEKCFVERKLDSAEILFNSVLDLDSKNVKALIGIAKIKYTQDEFENKVNKSSFSMEKNQQKSDMHAEIDYSKFYTAVTYLRPIENIAQDDIEFNYFNGIINREVYKYDISSDRKKARESAKNCFEKAIKKDSGYKDVIIQYALLRYDEEEYQDCLNLMKCFIGLKPLSGEGYVNLSQFINRHYNSEGFRRTKKLFSGNDDIDSYGLAVAKRKHEDFNESVADLKKLLVKADLKIPVCLIYRELLKNYAALDSAASFLNSYAEMQKSISEERDCDILFDDLKYLATKDEFKKYYNSDYKFKKDKWFAAFWARRAITGIEINTRVFEHYKRLVYAEDTYYLDRESFSFFKPAESYNSNKDFSDQGFIYIKFGEPDKINVGKETDMLKDLTLSDLSRRGKRPHEMDKQRIRSYDDDIKQNMSASHESWLYLPSSNNEKRIFHFFGIKKVLVSMIYNNEYINSMNDWDPVFEKISLDNRHSMSLNDEFNTSDALKNTLSDSSKIELITGISQDRSKVNLTRKQVQLDFDIYKFKGEENKVQIMISYFLPLPEIFKELPSDAKLISFLSGYDFYDQDWNLITGKHDSIVFNRETDGIRPKVKFLSFEVETGKLNGNIYCNPIGEGISCFSKSMIDIPGYTTTGLCASDLMISVVDFKATGNGKKWDKYYLLPSPTNRWSLRKPINLYYEIYNLKKNQEGKTLFRLEYAFRYKGSNENLLKKIFGQENNEVVSTEYTKSGQTAVSNEFIAFDLNRLTPGSYIMEITVKDMNADKNITLKKEVELF